MLGPQIPYRQADGSQIHEALWIKAENAKEREGEETTGTKVLRVAQTVRVSQNLAE